MKTSLWRRWALWLCAGLLALQLTSTNASAAAASTASKAPGAQFAQSLSLITGVAISPLLGTSAYGAIKYMQTPADKRAALPWFAQPWFWVPALLIVAACFAKDTAGTALPTALKKPLDVIDTMEHKVSGLIAAGAFVPFVMALSHDLGADKSMLNAMGLAAIDMTWLYNLLIIPVSIVAFLIVFLASNAINILILLSPFTTVDTALKTFRTAVLGTVAASAWVNPWLGAAWALIIIGISYFFAGWSLRLSHFGVVFLWEYCTFRHKRYTPTESNRLFLSRKLNKVPARTYGKLTRNPAGGLTFRYHPWLVLPERVLELPPGDYAVGHGLFYSEILKVEGDEAQTVILLPPRYRGHEAELARIYQFAGTREVGLRAAWTWFKEFCGGKTQPLPA